MAIYYSAGQVRYKLCELPDGTVNVYELARMAAESYADRDRSCFEYGSFVESLPEEFVIELDSDGLPMGKFKAITRMEPVTSIVGVVA